MLYCKGKGYQCICVNEYQYEYVYEGKTTNCYNEPQCYIARVKDISAYVWASISMNVSMRDKVVITMNCCKEPQCYCKGKDDQCTCVSEYQYGCVYEGTSSNNYKLL